MPLLKSSYQPPFVFKNYHISTVYASLFRKPLPVKQIRERVELADGDFIDIDWSYSNSASKKVLVILHGLEGNAQRPYITGLANYFNIHNWNVAAVNFRGCSGEINRLYRSYNAGASEDLQEIVTHVLPKNNYTHLAINGFSLGGNLLLKYLGEGNALPPQLKAAVAISTPCDLHGSLKKLEEPKNRLYTKRFIKKLKSQLILRGKHFPAELSPSQILECESLLSIDDLYTSKAHGFKDALDYYKKSSSLNFLQYISTPTLLINAKNDGFLSDSCYPEAIAKRSPNFFLETPLYGGHVGFIQNKKQTYTEERALEFISSFL
ncbi:alpha/beta fold hydrolase [Gillisia sp. M10.2A]|uniref:Alpha/beta fold hydrolase n=1 Tax=Gillisia lutea TaxID=2909668 RepID=A0ABS9EG21_9FLAO|nr:alpha/beta fold hydrolase [Gillisia lutea]MCF4100725.1 alpha/beta fold hydrolase [Gillisia lutea]